MGDVVYKTKDQAYYKELESMLDHEFHRYDLHLKVYVYPGSKLVIDAEGLGHQYLYESEEILEEAQKSSTTREQVEKQLSKLNDTIFTLKELEFEDYNAFIPVKMLNEARRAIVAELYELKIGDKQNRTKESEPKAKIAREVKEPYLTAAVTTKAQYDACKEARRELFFALESEADLEKKLRILHLSVLRVIDFTITYLEA